MNQIEVIRKKTFFAPNHNRVLARSFIPEDDRVKRRLKRILSLSQKESKTVLEDVYSGFAERHKDITRVFEKNFRAVKEFIDGEKYALSKEQKLLIGACFTMEYSIEAAAFFNPSVVKHPYQGELEDGSTRVIMSFRAVGEGHISSITFRSGIIDSANQVHLDPVSPFVESPEIMRDPFYEKKLFMNKLKEIKAYNEVSIQIMKRLPERFLYEELIKTVQESEKEIKVEVSLEFLKKRTIDEILWLAQSNYESHFHTDQDISERVLFPVSTNEKKGIEDARFVMFEESPGKFTYYATYTAYDGATILPQLIKTDDFITFKITTLNGNAVQNKGMALFPRKIGNRFVMTTRKDNENLYIAFSDNIHFWGEADLLIEPKFVWEVTQIGNCGSPLETSDGWLLLTHGVGPMRRYCIGVVLLDLENPAKVIGRLNYPLIEPTETEREGYVPNVVYSCGSIIHNDMLVIPYAMSDTYSGLAEVPLKPLLEALKKEG